MLCLLQLQGLQHACGPVQHPARVGHVQPDHGPHARDHGVQRQRLEPRRGPDEGERARGVEGYCVLEVSVSVVRLAMRWPQGIC